MYLYMNISQRSLAMPYSGVFQRDCCGVRCHPGAALTSCHSRWLPKTPVCCDETCRRRRRRRPGRRRCNSCDRLMRIRRSIRCRAYRHRCRRPYDRRYAYFPRVWIYPGVAFAAAAGEGRPLCSSFSRVCWEVESWYYAARMHVY